MKIIILKNFIISGKEFKKGEVLDIPFYVLNILRNKGLVEPIEVDSKSKHNYYPVELSKACANCGSNKWLILKSNPRASLIKCFYCEHLEIYILGVNIDSDDIKQLFIEIRIKSMNSRKFSA